MQLSPPVPRRRGVSPERLAASLLDLWVHLIQGNGQRLVQVIEELDVSLTQVKLLDALTMQAPHDPSMKRLSEIVGCSMPSASRAIDSLQRRGWVERREDGQDRRIKRLRITPAGREANRSISTARLAGLETFAAGLSPEQRVTLHAAITALPHTKDAASTPPARPR